MHLSKTSAIQPPSGARPLGKIEVLPNAIHTIAMQATSECYGVVGLTAPRLHQGRAVLLPPEQSNQGVQVRVVNEQIIIEVYVALEYGLRMSEIAHNIMSSVKFSVEEDAWRTRRTGKCKCPGTEPRPQFPTVGARLIAPRARA